MRHRSGLTVGVFELPDNLYHRPQEVLMDASTALPDVEPDGTSMEWMFPTIADPVTTARSATKRFYLKSSSIDAAALALSNALLHDL